jgi:hypothetical protein
MKIGCNKRAEICRVGDEGERRRMKRDMEGKNEDRLQ